MRQSLAKSKDELLSRKKNEKQQTSVTKIVTLIGNSKPLEQREERQPLDFGVESTFCICWG